MKYLGIMVLRRNSNAVSHEFVSTLNSFWITFYIIEKIADIEWIKKFLLEIDSYTRLKTAEKVKTVKCTVAKTLHLYSQEDKNPWFHSGQNLIGTLTIPWISSLNFNPQRTKDSYFLFYALFFLC